MCDGVLLSTEAASMCPTVVSPLKNRMWLQHSFAMTGGLHSEPATVLLLIINKLFLLFFLSLSLSLSSSSRAAEILFSLAMASIKHSGKPTDFPALENYKLLSEARKNLGLFQHHDAITGTGKDWVVVDYGTR